MATELGDRIKHEGEKLRALELVTLPVRKKQPKQRSKFKTFTLVSLCVGIGFAIFKAVRNRGGADQAFTPPRPADKPESTATQNGIRDPRLATASL